MYSDADKNCSLSLPNISISFKINISSFLSLNNTLFSFFYRFLFYILNKSSYHSRCRLCLTFPIVDWAISFFLTHKTKIRGFLQVNNTFYKFFYIKFYRLHSYDYTASSVIHSTITILGNLLINKSFFIFSKSFAHLWHGVRKAGDTTKSTNKQPPRTSIHHEA